MLYLGDFLLAALYHLDGLTQERGLVGGSGGVDGRGGGGATLFQRQPEVGDNLNKPVGGESAYRAEVAAEVVVDVVALSLGGLSSEEFEELEGDLAGAVFFGLVGLSGYAGKLPRTACGEGVRGREGSLGIQPKREIQE